MHSSFSVRFALLTLLWLPACSGTVGTKPQTPPPPTPNSQPAPIQPAPVHRPAATGSIALPAATLFDMGQEGEKKYKGKVVYITGKVSMKATKRTTPGGTTTVVMEGDTGEPPYALATVGEDSVPLLFEGKPGWDWDPSLIAVEGVYRERDGRGTIVVDNAKVVSRAEWFPQARAGRKPTRDPKPPTTPKEPVIVSAEQLAQEIQDNASAAYKRYSVSPLQVEGVISKRNEDKGAIHMIQMAPPIKDSKTGKPALIVIYCSLRTPIPLGDKAAEKLAVGMKVKIRGSLLSAAGGEAMFGPCEIVSD
jgi:hypothetical protein